MRAKVNELNFEEKKYIVSLSKGTDLGKMSVNEIEKVLLSIVKTWSTHSDSDNGYKQNQRDAKVSFQMDIICTGGLKDGRSKQSVEVEVEMCL